jgi:isopenicillin-N N-acyltransferase like protein
MAEIRGIANGAAVDELDVLALNLRTEILAIAQADATNPLAIGECTAFAVPPTRSETGNVLLGQNWDWMIHSPQTVVVLEVEQDERPNFTTVVEAGLIAKIGLNAHGVGVATNALQTRAGVNREGVPYHILLRSLFDCRSFGEAVGLVETTQHASSANFLIASSEGVAIDIETEPYQGQPPRHVDPFHGIYVHTNHFLAGGFETVDLGPTRYPSTQSRLETAQRLVCNVGPVALETLERALSDHDHYPLSVCAHPDTSAAPDERGLTAASVVMDLTLLRAWIADGNPCCHPYRELDCSWLPSANCEHSEPKGGNPS